MSWDKVYNNLLIGSYSIVIVLVFSEIFRYLLDGIQINLFSVIGVFIYLGLSIFLAGYFVNKVVLNHHFNS
jgi:hypothetical protein